MIRRKVSQIQIRNRLKKLEEQTSRKALIPILFVHIEEDGHISVYEHVGAPTTYYETMFEAEAALIGMRGVTSKTKLIIDDTLVWWCDLYLPTDPILYFCNSVERKLYIGLQDNNEWMTFYIDLVRRIQRTALENPDTPLPGFDDPALKDLVQNYNSMTIEQLTERYKDNRWFRGNK